MTSKKVLALDPSGNFYEGKGTTGWCVLSCGNAQKILRIDSIHAGFYPTQMEYWDAHIALLQDALKKYKSNLVVSMEDFLLYASAAQTQINSHFETPQLIGVVKMWCYQNNVPLYIRPAHAVKQRWSDDILKKKRFIVHTKGKWYCSAKAKSLCDHEIDALRHAIHCATFELDRS